VWGELTKRARTAFDWANGLTRGSLGVLRDAIRGFTEARAAEAATSLAFYVFFSLFPLLLVLVSAGSFALQSDQAQQRVLDLLTGAIPVSQDLIKRDIQHVLDLRGTIGIVGLVTLMWSASGAFTVLVNNINRAWSGAPPRTFLQNRLMALSIVGILTALLGVSLFSTATLDVLDRLNVPLWGNVTIYETSLWPLLKTGLPWLVAFLVFLLLYRWVPSTEVRWSHAFWGGLVAAVGWKVATDAFIWFLSMGFVRYRLVYGSLGAVVALLYWIYLGSWIALFGAHLSAATARRGR
jgi:YihY family inner membrane protein